MTHFSRLEALLFSLKFVSFFLILMAPLLRPIHPGWQVEPLQIYTRVPNASPDTSSYPVMCLGLPPFPSTAVAGCTQGCPVRGWTMRTSHKVPGQRQVYKDIPSPVLWQEREWVSCLGNFKRDNIQGHFPILLIDIDSNILSLGSDYLKLLWG